MPKLEQKKFTLATRLKISFLRRLKDKFYVVAIILIILGVLVLNYSYIEPKPYKEYVVHNVCSVNITNKTIYYSTGFTVGGQFTSNISFYDPNGTPFTYRLFCMSYYTNSYGIPVSDNYTVQENYVEKTNYTSYVNAYGVPITASLIIETNAPHLHIVVTELSWYITRNQSNLFLDEIGESILVAGIITIVGRLSYNTSSRTKEKNLANTGRNNKVN